MEATQAESIDLPSTSDRIKQLNDIDKAFPRLLLTEEIQGTDYAE
jgi:hypothetical protein